MRNHHCKICLLIESKTKFTIILKIIFVCCRQMLIFHTKKKNFTEQIRMFKIIYLFIENFTTCGFDFLACLWIYIFLARYFFHNQCSNSYRAFNLFFKRSLWAFILPTFSGKFFMGSSTLWRIMTARTLQMVGRKSFKTPRNSCNSFYFYSFGSPHCKLYELYTD